jgi:hypothetical protein
LWGTLLPSQCLRRLHFQHQRTPHRRHERLVQFLETELGESLRSGKRIDGDVSPAKGEGGEFTMEWERGGREVGLERDVGVGENRGLGDPCGEMMRVVRIADLQTAYTERVRTIPQDYTMDM